MILTKSSFPAVEAISILRKDLKVPFHRDNNSNLSAMAEQWFAAPGTAGFNNFVFVTPRGGLGQACSPSIRLWKCSAVSASLSNW